MKIETHSGAEMKACAGRLAASLARAEEAVVLALSGELGAGKTTFVQGLAEAFGATAPVQSPTFVLMKSYPLSKGPFRVLIHLDCYRIENPQELEILGFKQLLKNPDAVIAVEWPERAASFMPENAKHLAFTAGSGDTRYLEERP